MCSADNAGAKGHMTLGNILGGPSESTLRTFMIKADSRVNSGCASVFG